jgi:hypothetical protein
MQWRGRFAPRHHRRALPSALGRHRAPAIERLEPAVLGLLKEHLMS